MPLRNGTAAMASSSVIDWLGLGQWCSEQRSLYGRGKLSDECVERLRVLPGWEWDRHDANWEYMFTLLQRFVAREGTALVPREHWRKASRSAAGCGGSDIQRSRPPQLRTSALYRQIST
jgi:hypothetical protein